MIELKQITKTYQQGQKQITALQQIDLTIPEGSFVTIQGKSGCGKTSLLKIIGLVEVPDQGDYFLNGKKVNLSNDVEFALLRNRNLSFVTQSPSLLESASVEFNVLLPYFIRKEKIRPELTRKLEASLDAVGMRKYQKVKVAQLSGGERQRVCIVRALLSGADYILADEPTGNLDKETGGEIIKELAFLVKQGKTIIMATHDLEFASRGSICLHMEDGRILF